MIRKIFEAGIAMDQLQEFKDGRSLIRQIYHQSLPDKPRVPWKCLIYRNAARTKTRFTTQLLILGRMLTNERLLKWGMEVTTNCILCQNYREHLFVQCDYTRRVRDKVAQWLQIQSGASPTWEQHLRWVIENSKGKSQKTQLFKIIYSELTYNIWIERNRRIFEKRSRSWETLPKKLPLQLVSPGLIACLTNLFSGSKVFFFGQKRFVLLS